ncbi:MAG: HAD family hydrolase [Sedimentisphaerales bacterium]|nr:HAD family hydrolase [Sedimentisphaerales bacterium]
MITTVVFDLDDTLYDEIEYCRSGLLAVSQHISHLSDATASDLVFAVLWKHFTAGDRTRVFNAALDELHIPWDADLIGGLVDLYRTHVPTIALPPETRSALDELQETHALALLTDGFLPAQKLKVRALGIEDDFRAIVYTEELGRPFWKPSARGFELLLETLDVAASETAYVGDNAIKDFIAPNELGFTTIQILRPARLHVGVSDLPHAAAGHKVHKIDQLPGLLRQL